MAGFHLPNIPSAYLSNHSDGEIWSVIVNGMPVAQGSLHNCLLAAERQKVVLPDYHWSGKDGKWFNNNFGKR